MTLLKSLKSVNKIKTSDPKVLWKLRCKLGEGTLWVKEHNSIYFVDIKKKSFFSFNTKKNKKSIYKVNKEIGFLAHIKGYVFILGLQGELRIQNIKTKKIIKSIFIEKDIKLNRINDGKTDPVLSFAGSLKLGSLFQKVEGKDYHQLSYRPEWLEQTEPEIGSDLWVLEQGKPTVSRLNFADLSGRKHLEP